MWSGKRVIDLKKNEVQLYKGIIFRRCVTCLSPQTMEFLSSKTPLFAGQNVQRKAILNLQEKKRRRLKVSSFTFIQGSYGRLEICAVIFQT